MAEGSPRREPPSLQRRSRAARSQPDDQTSASHAAHVSRTGRDPRAGGRRLTQPGWHSAPPSDLAQNQQRLPPSAGPRDRDYMTVSFPPWNRFFAPCHFAHVKGFSLTEVRGPRHAALAAPGPSYRRRPPRRTHESLRGLQPPQQILTPPTERGQHCPRHGPSEAPGAGPTMPPTRGSPSTPSATRRHSALSSPSLWHLPIGCPPGCHLHPSDGPRLSGWMQVPRSDLVLRGTGAQLSPPPGPPALPARPVPGAD